MQIRPIILFFLVGCKGLTLDTKLISDTAIPGDTSSTSNSPPVVLSVTLPTDPVYTNDILTAVVEINDSDSMQISTSFEWHVIDEQNATGDLIVQSGLAESLDGANYFERGNDVYVVVLPSDGIDEGDPLTSNTIRILNSAPTQPVIEITPQSAYAGIDDLSCTVVEPSLDADQDSVKYTFIWSDPNGVEVQNSGEIPGTTNVLDGALTIEGGWVCTVIPSDRTESGEAASAFVPVQEPPSLYPFTSHMFTHCGQSGYVGPSRSQCESSYSSQSWVSDAAFYDTQSGVQMWTVPISGTYQIEVFGAQGGPNHCGDVGGLGAQMSGEFSLQGGTILNIIVGQAGVVSNSGNCSNGGGGGGGCSFVWESSESLPLIVAGGGGGSGLTNNGYPNCIGMDALTTNDGSAARDGSAGGTAGGDGNNGGGKGWINIQIKPEGSDGSGNSYNGTGGFGGGGRGGNPMDCGNNQHSPGAGGGYSGGGATVTCYHAGGGGGSYNIGANSSEQAGIQSGDGRVIITYLGN